jgi:methylmalonyl-CoA mutase N-terminal domain/subunit
LGSDDLSIRYNVGKEGWAVATREELKQLIDGMPVVLLFF